MLNRITIKKECLNSLLGWIMTDLEIMAMADPTIHGTDNVTRTMREIDAESPWPEEGLEFVTLWCRAINVSCSEWKFMLRYIYIFIDKMSFANQY